MTGERNSDVKVTSVATTRQRALRDAAATLTPAQALDTVDAAAGRLTGAVTLAATVSGGLGLVTATRLADVPIGWALPSVFAAAGSILLAILATVPVRSTARPGDLTAMEWWFEGQMRRRVGLIQASAVLLAVALLTAALPAVVDAVDAKEPRVTGRLIAEPRNTAAEAVASRLPSNAALRATVSRGVDTLASAEAYGNEDGNAKASIALGRVRGSVLLRVEAVDGKQVLASRDVTVTVPRRR